MANDELFNVGVKALILNRKKEVLVLCSGPLESRYSKVRFWDLPGGRIKPGEEIFDALRREVREELGVPPRNLTIGGLFGVARARRRVLGGKLALLLVTYLSKIKNQKEFAISPEHSEWRWVKPAAAKKLLATKFPRNFLRELDRLR